ncbi:MAG: preprotein translocase subunit SecD [Halohasta sp.]
MGTIKSNWRVALLIVFVLLSGVALLGPTGESADSGDSLGNDSEATGLTNLKFGLDLSGGTRIEAPLTGMTAEDVEFDGDSESQVADAVAEELPDSDTTDVIARGETEERGATIEVVNPDISEDEFAAAIDDAGYEYGEIRTGVTDETGEEAISVLEGKVNQAGLSGATVQETRANDEQFYVQIEVPGEGLGDVRELIENRGTVRVDLYHDNNGDGEYDTERAVLTRDDFQSVSTATQSDRMGPHVPVTVREDAAEEFQQTAVDTGLAGEGGSQCSYEENPDSTEPCLLLVVDGEVVNSFGMAPDLADDIRGGDWLQDTSFVLTTTDYTEAQEVAINLRAGALPAPLDIESGTSSFISPTQGENFQFDSLIVGILAVLSVSAVVFWRYRDPKVALPMIVTAFSEVIILLGFAAYLGYPLDLAVIAGFIAVIGTGVDDLVIIADEVMSEGDVSSRRVFKSRFRRAFWVIGVAAATTIIAMTPLAVLPLGNLRGFAIFTILGVLVGVLITRPAYGDILRYLVTDR